MNAITALQKEIHSKIKINDANMLHVADQHMVPVLLHEFVKAAAEYPLVFVKNSETGQFQAVCLLGLKPKENKFVSKESWVGGYIPLGVRHNPLCLITQAEDTNQFLIGINETSLRIGLESGDALFTPEGEETEYFIQRKNALIDYYEKEQIGQAIIQLLLEFDLLIAETVSVTTQKENLTLNGFYIISEDRLNALPGDKFLQLREKSLLPVIYAQMFSLQQLHRLATFSSAT